jgi:hypothetical protein
MNLIIKSDDMLRLENIVRYQSTYMVAEAMQEARQRANDYAASGGRRRDPKTRRYQARFGAPRRMRRATGSMIASMAEKMFYRRFLNFWTV